MLGRQPPFQKRPCIHTRRRVPLKINQVAWLISIARMKEMVEPNLKQRRNGRIRGNVPADAVIELVLPRYHSHRVPTRQALDTPLERAVAGIGHFFARWNGVDVWGVLPDRQIYTDLPGTLRNMFQNEGGAVRPCFFHHLIERFQPLASLLGIEIDSLGSLLMHLYYSL